MALRPKTLCVLLLCCLAAPVLISYGWLQHQKTRVHKEVKRQLLAGKADEELVLLRFSQEETKTQLRWEHSREFEYQGQMYDIVRTEQRGDTILYYCWWDREETALNNEITRLTANVLNNNPEQQSQQERLFSFLKTLYNSCIAGWHLFLIIECTERITADPNVYQPRPTLSPPAPPPEMV